VVASQQHVVRFLWQKTMTHARNALNMLRIITRVER